MTFDFLHIREKHGQAEFHKESFCQRLDAEVLEITPSNNVRRSFPAAIGACT
jgi:hypothetical protein